MSKKIRTSFQRNKLKTAREPYWQKLDHPKGAALGVRVGEQLTWIARVYHHGKYSHKSLGAVADHKYDYAHASREASEWAALVKDDALPDVVQPADLNGYRPAAD